MDHPWRLLTMYVWNCINVCWWIGCKWCHPWRYRRWCVWCWWLQCCFFKNFGQLVKCFHLVVANVGKRCCWSWVLQCIDKFCCCYCCIFCRGAKRHFRIVWKKFDRVGLNDCPCLWYINIITAIMIFGAINIPSITSSRSHTWFVVYNYFCSRRCKRCCIIVKLAM